MAISTGDKVTRKYEDFRGVDFRGDECAINRSPHALNVWRNYRKPYGIETRPAIVEQMNNLGHIKDMKWYKEHLYIIATDHSAPQNKDMYLHQLKLDGEGGATQWYDIANLGENGFFFYFNEELYAMGQYGIVNVSQLPTIESGGTPYITKYHIPTTSIGALPNGAEREIKQDVNMLTQERINTFRGDGESTIFHLDTEELYDYQLGDAPPIVLLDGVDVFEGKELVDINKTTNIIEYVYVRTDDKGDYMSVDLKRGEITIVRDAFPLPAPTGDYDNISIQFKAKANNKDKILGCTIAQEFDNRIFLSGNPKCPNTIFHSSLNDVTYFSDSDVYEDGKDIGRIRQMVAGNNALWVFRETDTGNGVYYHSAAFDSTYGKVYPFAHSNIAISCVGGAINFLDDIVFFSRQGMESITQDITKEQFATHKSSMVDRLMLNNPDYKDMVLVEWEGYLLVCIGADVFLADSRAILANENHYEYEWYHWNLGEHKITCATLKDDALYLGTDGGGRIYKIDFTLGKDVHSENEQAIESYWTTPKDKFGTPNKVKTTNKKGFIVEAKGDVKISTRVDGETTFDDGEAFQDVEDHIVTKIKRKKFKDMQIKFYSNTRFSLESATLEAFVGGYIKR